MISFSVLRAFTRFFLVTSDLLIVIFGSIFYVLVLAGGFSYMIEKIKEFFGKSKKDQEEPTKTNKINDEELEEDIIINIKINGDGHGVKAKVVKKQEDTKKKQEKDLEVGRNKEDTKNTEVVNSCKTNNKQENSEENFEETQKENANDIKDSEAYVTNKKQEENETEKILRIKSNKKQERDPKNASTKEVG